MKSLNTLAAFMLLSTTAYAKDITITLNDADQQTELAALDAYVKSGGLNVTIPVVKLLQKIQEAAQSTDTSKDIPK